LLVENSGFGVRDTGSTCAGNTRQGILLTTGVSGAQIGSVANPNGISCNGTQGISISGSNNNTITGNHIGRSLGFGGALAAGNSDSGISVLNSTGTVISDNIIGSNTQFGITLATANNTTISDNQIGLPNTIPLTSSGNGAGGIRSGLSNDVLIDSNQIANNGADGVLVSSGARVEIIDNTIFANVGLGVDLGTNGVNANDPTDSDTGANALLNYPLLTNAATDGTTLLLEGNFPAPTGSYDLLIYENAACDASGFGEGETLLTTINGVANGTLSINPALAPTVGNFITILAIDRNGGATDGNTSEFSNCIEITAALNADFTATPTTVVVGQTVTFTNLSTGFITGYSWDFGDTGGATTRNATHAYLAAGTYTVTLTISGPGGTDTDTLLITVVNPTATPLPSNTPVPATPIPVTATNTPLLPTSTNTATVTRTPIPPSATTTPRPPTLTRTPLPPTSTSTPRPPTATATLVPSATLTVPPTMTLVSTETRTPIPTLPPTIEVTKISDGDQNVQIDIVNSGSGSAQDVVLIETLRDEVRYISSIPGSPRCLESGGIVVCELGTIPPGATSSVGITVQTNGVDPASGQTVVTVGGVPGAVVNEPYIIKVGEPPVAGPGAEITYTIRVINATNESALNLQVVDQMPDAIEILTGETSAGTLTIDGQDVLVELDELEAGGRLTIVLQTRVREDGDYPEIINEACLTSSGNATARCAMMSFLRAGALPNTGETPVYALLLRGGLMLLALLVMVTIPLLWWQIKRR
jgi:uncharacterized repeat protein (TIGR01451 family)